MPRMQLLLAAIAGCVLAAALTGCSRFRPKPKPTYVYVTAKQMFLRDRVAAVSNRTGEVKNGERLEVLDHLRRFIKVRTPSGEEGWLEDRSSVIATQQTVDTFEALAKEHANDPVVGQAIVRDEALLHIAPGRKTPSLYRLQENTPLTLLERAVVPKPLPPGMVRPVVITEVPHGAAAGKPSAHAAESSAADASLAPPPPVMEDWWLVRDRQGQTGWIYSRLIDESAPDSLLRYAEGQRIVGAYVLTYVDDPDSGLQDNGVPVTRVPVYVTVLNSYKSGLPYDFAEVRVFTWNQKKHRYETGFREKNIEGYLPVEIATANDPYSKQPSGMEKLPSFTYRVLADGQPMPQPDPVTGLIKPGQLITKTYRLEGNICHRIGIAPGTQAPEEAHPEPEPKKAHASRVSHAKAKSRAEHSAEHRAAAKHRR